MASVISLPEMVDVAIGSPEVGAFNLNLLHTILHVIINQLNLQETKIEFRGKDSDRLKTLMTVKSSAPQITIKDSAAANAGIVIVDGGAAKGGTKGGNTVVIEGAQPGPNQPIVYMNQFIDLQSRFDSISKMVEEMFEMAHNKDMIEAVTKGEEDTGTPVTNMWKILNLIRRMDAAEKLIEKLTSLFQEMSVNMGHQQPKDDPSTTSTITASEPVDLSEIRDKFDAIEAQLSAMDEKLKFIEEQVEAIPNEPGQVADPTTPEGGRGSNLSDKFTDLKKEIGAVRHELHAFMREEKEKGHQAGGETSASDTESNSTVATVDNERVNNLEEKINALDNMMNDQINGVQAQIGSLERELGVLIERINTGGIPGGDSSDSAQQDVGGLADIYNKITALQQDIDNINNTAASLQDDKDERLTRMNALLEQIDLLKTTKADKEDLEDALADKADQQLVNRKVSHDQFDAACDDLSRSLEETLAKLTQQEGIWQTALTDVQREITNKLDKNELAPLRDFVNSKLKALQERLKAIAALKKETEAAGTKSKLLREVNCISCDKNVIMKRDNQIPPVPACHPLPANRSMRPYLTYELDAVRKQTKKLPTGRNMNNFETAVKEDHHERAKSRERGDEINAEDHLCNRYCGGSHTTTTPQQRVTRLGHFLKQWGPEAIPLMEGVAKGTDGQIYKVREDPRPNSASTDPGTGKVNIQLQKKQTDTVSGSKSSLTKSSRQ